jgi:nitroreductase
MDYRKAAEERKSIREFTDKQIPENIREDLMEYGKNCLKLIPELETEFIITDGAKYNYLEEFAGYEGLTFKAPYYLILLSAKKQGYLENAGYISEDMILHMTDMGIDSCWLTVNEGEALKQQLGLDTDMAVVAVTALGYGKKQRTLTTLHIKSKSDVEIRTREGHVAPKITLEEMVYGDTWHKPADLGEMYVDDGLRNALLAASYAPTFLNRQSFRLVMTDGKLLFVKILDPLTDEVDAKLNCGAVMLNFAAVLEERRPFMPQWVLGAPDINYQLPADCEIVAYCNL